MASIAFETVRLFLACNGLSFPDAAGKDPEIPEGLDSHDLLDDRFELICAPGTKVGGTWQGRFAYDECGAKVMSFFDVETKSPKLHDAGDTVFLTSRTIFKAKDGRETPELPGVEIWQVGGDKIVSCTILYSETQSLEKISGDGVAA